MTKQFKLVLVQPIFFNPKMDRNQSTLMPLGLAYVASLTPSNWDVTIYDEQIERFPFPEADLVGITTTTGSINRAYEIAAHYRAKKIPVVLGGVHASLLPDEALQYGDSVVCGDAEPVWTQVIADVEAGQLKKRYNSPIAELTNLKPPRRDLIRNDYIFDSISTSRGCPFRCTFCCIHNFYEHTYRLRPIEDVITELKTLKKRMLFFTDGNLYGYTKEARARFLELCRRMTEEKRHFSFTLGWMAYASTNILDDHEALEAAAKAGCRNLLIGFESISPEALKEMKKAVNLPRVAKYSELIENAAKYGIMVTAEIIFGFDSDNIETIEATKRFIKEAKIDVLRLQLLQPLPGTETYAKLDGENRLYIGKYPEDWLKFRDNFILGTNFELKQLEPYFLKKTVVEMGMEFYSIPNIIRSAFRVARRFRSISMFVYFVIMALKSRKSYRNYKVNPDDVAAEVALGKQRQQESLSRKVATSSVPC